MFLDGFKTRDGDPLPMIIQKSDGGYNYATTDLAATAMMGMHDMVRAVVDAYPGAVDWKGPHGISLLRHAVVGDSEEVAEFLKSRGAA